MSYDDDDARSAAPAPLLGCRACVLALGVATIVAFPISIAGLARFLLVGA